MKRGSASKDQLFRLLHLGEQGLTVELGDTVDSEVNARVHRLAATLRTEALAGVTELVPTYRSLLIIFDPLRISRNELTERITRRNRRVTLSATLNPGILLSEFRRHEFRFSVLIRMEVI